MAADAAIQVMEEAIARRRMPDIVNTGRDIPFAAAAGVDVPRRRALRIITHGNERWRGPVFGERMWNSVKYEHVCLDSREATSGVRTKQLGYRHFRSRRRPHASLDRRVRDGLYFNKPPP